MEKKHSIWNLILSVALLVITLGLFGPLEMYLSNKSEIWFSVSDVLKVICIITGAMVLFLGLLGWLLKGKARAWFGASVFLLGIALFIQGTYLNIDFGVLDGKSIDWNQYVTYGIINTIIWLAIFIIGFILFVRKERFFEFAQKIGSGIIIAIEAITLIVLLLTAGDLYQANNVTSYLSTDGIYSAGKDENIIIFIVDCLDEEYFQNALEQSEEYNYVYKDFTHYDNAAVAAATTKAALPAIITGKAYPGGISYQEYINQAFDSDGLYTTLRKKGYDTRIYTDSGFVAQGVGDRIANQTGSGYKVSSYFRLTAKYEQLCLFKYLPYVIKPFAWIYTGDLEEYKSGAEGEAYTIDDIKYYHDLMENGIQVIPGKSFRLYHLNGSHPPYIYDSEVTKSNASDVIQQTKGAFKIIAEYIEELKKKELYDSATIIIMADHGEKNSLFPKANYPHGALLVKEAEQKADIMRTSSSPISYWDLHDELYSIIDSGKGKKFSETDNTDKIRIYYKYNTEHGAVIWNEYQIQGNLNENGTIMETGNVLKQDFQKEDYKYGQELKFGLDATAARYVTSGVSATDEGSHSYTDGKIVVFDIPLESKPRENLLVTIKCAGVYHEAGPQVLYLYANKVLCDKRIMNEGGTYEFVVPGTTIGEDKKLELKMVLPYAASPKKLFGEKNRADRRMLGIALMGLIIEETDKEGTEATINEIVLDKEYQFVEGENEANNFFIKGLSKSEKDYTWTEGKYLIMESKLKEAITNDLEVAFSIKRVFNKEQYCRIRSGDEILFDATLSEEDKEISFTIPNKCLIDGKEIHLMIELPNAISHKELGTGKDRRVVALSFTKMIIRDKQ